MNLIASKGATIALGVFALTASCSVPPNSTEVNNPSATLQQSDSESSNTAAIQVDGSSTVYPLTQEVAMELKFEQPDAPDVAVAFSGTGGGFRKFCAGETDINDASRPILKDEMEACAANGIEYIELPVAYDALTIVVHPDNDWADDITVAELKKMWEPAAEDTITTWNQIRSEWPDHPLNLYGAGQDSGTFDYFTEAIVGESGASRSDYTASEDDYELMRGIRQDPNALGYFGYAYYEEGQNVLDALPVDSGQGSIEPSSETVKSGEYQPLARPLFIYVNANAVQAKPELREFVEYYLTNAAFLAEVVGYIPLPSEAYGIALEHLASNRTGTAFDGVPRTDLTIEELLEKEVSF
ncbi:MAG TPA: PstS family phosphate ABC transporter substrate-binding protein [Elainellaceae cyanobacterium]|jgi:phosphate transport system substrate-binding protein